MCKERDAMPDSVRQWELRCNGASIKLTDVMSGEPLVIQINDIKYMKGITIDLSNQEGRGYTRRPEEMFGRKEVKATMVFTVHGDFKVKESLEQIGKFVEIVDATGE
jgi:hypothetical protein